MKVSEFMDVCDCSYNMYDEMYPVKFDFFVGSYSDGIIYQLSRDLSEIITIEEIQYDGCVLIGFSELVKKSMAELRENNIFADLDLFSSMKQLEMVINETIEASWYKKFVEILKKNL